MSYEKSSEASLRLEHIVFDDIEFHRHGFKSDGHFEATIQTNISIKTDENEVCKVTLILQGEKEKEYHIKISLTGYFIIEHSKYLYAELERQNLLSQNAVAILMPFLRSEVTLLTSQPEIEGIVLPIFNVRKIFSNHKQKE